MAKILLIPVLFAGLIASPQVQERATEERGRADEAKIIWDGNFIYSFCQHYKTEQLKGSLGPACFMYVAGVSQTLVLNDKTERTMTPPCPGRGVTNEQITDVVIKWLDDHPEQRHQAAPYIVMEALKEAFPCD